jgi:hypothetical protein
VPFALIDTRFIAFINQLEQFRMLLSSFGQGSLADEISCFGGDVEYESKPRNNDCEYDAGCECFFHSGYLLFFLYYSTLLEVCQVLFLVSGELFHQIPDNVILTICVVFIGATANDAFLLHLIHDVDDAEAVDSQVHRNLTQAETIGVVGKQFSNLFFHWFIPLSFICLYYSTKEGFCQPLFFTN